MPAIAAPLVFMMNNPIAILACVISNIVIGMLWYSLIFKKPWGKLSGMDKVPKQKMKRVMFPAMIISTIAAIVQASVLGTILSVIQVDSYVNLLSLIFLLWLPFSASIMATGYAYTMKSPKLLFIDAVYPLVTWVAMAFIFLNVHY